MKTHRRFPLVLVALLLAPPLAMATGLPRAQVPAVRNFAAQSPAAQIDALIARVAQAHGVVFIRNGSEHTATEAAAHLQRKLRAAHGRITTPEQFIDVLGTRSSLSGRPYQVRFADGHVVDSAAWLRQLLREVRAVPTLRGVSTPLPAARAAPLLPPAKR